MRVQVFAALLMAAFLGCFAGNAKAQTDVPLTPDEIAIIEVDVLSAGVRFKIIGNWGSCFWRPPCGARGIG